MIVRAGLDARLRPPPGSCKAHISIWVIMQPVMEPCRAQKPHPGTFSLAGHNGTLPLRGQ
jgi:hypothetical protein